MHLTKWERLTAKKKQSKSSTTNMPLNLLMVSTSPYSSSLQLAIKLLMGVDLWCSCSAGQVTRSHIKTYTISYFQWSLTHRKDISFFLSFFFCLQLFLREKNTISSTWVRLQKHKFLCACKPFSSDFIMFKDFFSYFLF